MGKMLLLLIVGLGLIFALTGLNIQRSNTSMVANSVLEYQRVQAKNYAASGIEIAIKNLSLDTNWTGIANKALYEGTVTINVQSTTSKYYNGPDMGLTSTRLITAISTVGEMKDTIRAVVKLPSAGGSSGVPGFFNYAVASGGNLHLNGNANIQDDFNPQWNANIHTNGNFQMNGVNTVKGFLSYVGNAQSNPSWRLDSNITPNQNPNNLPNRAQISPVEIPDFKAEDYLDVATDIFYDNKTYSGNIELGTAENPRIIYVDGNLNISGNITGYGAFIVKGNVHVTGNVNITSMDPITSNLGIYTNGNIQINGNVTLKAQILAKGNAQVGGNVKIHGSLVTKGNVQFNGGVNLYYRPSNEILTKPFWEGEGSGDDSVRPQLLSYYE